MDTKEKYLEDTREAVNPNREHKPQKTYTKPCLWVLLFYAGAATAAIIAISVLGTQYIDDLKAFNSSECSTNLRPPPVDQIYNDYKHYHVDNVKCSLDTEADKQLFRFSGAEYGNNTMAVLDFKKGLAGIYHGLYDTCFLIGGIDVKFPNSTQLERFITEPNMNTTGQERTYVNYLVIEDRPVKNLALLPAELHEPCWGKPVYWLEKTDETQGRRKRRGLKGCVKVCVGWSFWGICLGWKWEGCISIG